MKVWIVQFGDVRSGYSVRGVYVSRAAATGSLQKHADEFVSCYGGSPVEPYMDADQNLWSGYGKVACIVEREVDGKLERVGLND